MNRPSNSSGSDVARGAGFAAAKGALLIGIAVIIGVVLLQQSDNGSTPAKTATTATTVKPKPKTTATTSHATTTTTTAPTAAAKSPAELRVLVLNAGGPAKAASKMSQQLQQKNYTNQAPANNWSDKTLQGNAVYCNDGLEREGTALAVAVGNTSGKSEPMPNPAPPYINDDPSKPVECVVAVGSTDTAGSTDTTTGNG